MDARVRLSARGQLSDHPGRRCGHESKRVDDRAVAATTTTAMSGRAIILDSAHMMLNERKDDGQETQATWSLRSVSGLGSPAIRGRVLSAYWQRPGQLYPARLLSSCCARS